MVPEKTDTPGSRVPAVWIRKDGKFHICNMFGAGSFSTCEVLAINLDEVYHIVLQQCLENGEVVYKIEINNEIIVSNTITNTNNAVTFDLVKLYVSNPWDTAFDSQYGSVENFKFQKTCDGTF